MALPLLHWNIVTHMLSKHELRFHLAMLYSKGNKYQQMLHTLKKHFIDVMVLKMYKYSAKEN